MAKMHGVTMQCPWPGGNSAFRIFMVLCGFSCVSLLVVALIKKEFFWANWAVSTASTNRTVTNFEHCMAVNSSSGLRGLSASCTLSC